MSGQAQGKVYTMAVTGSDMLVLLAYADHADDYGKRIYPSLDTIAWKIGLSRRQVQRITKRYVDLGWLRAIGKTEQGVNRLEFDYDVCSYKPDLDTPKSIEIDDEGVTPRCHGGGDIAMSRGGDIAMSHNPSLTVIEPSLGAIAPNVSIADSTQPLPNNPITRTDTMNEYGKSHDLFLMSKKDDIERKISNCKRSDAVKDVLYRFHTLYPNLGWTQSWLPAGEELANVLKGDLSLMDDAKKKLVGDYTPSDPRGMIKTCNKLRETRAQQTTKPAEPALVQMSDGTWAKPYNPWS